MLFSKKKVILIFQLLKKTRKEYPVRVVIKKEKENFYLQKIF